MRARAWVRRSILGTSRLLYVRAVERGGVSQWTSGLGPGLETEDVWVRDGDEDTREASTVRHMLRKKTACSIALTVTLD